MLKNIKSTWRRKQKEMEIFGTKNGFQRENKYGPKFLEIGNIVLTKARKDLNFQEGLNTPYTLIEEAPGDQWEIIIVTNQELEKDTLKQQNHFRK
ncbi:hypothetical protein [[Flexibacter] sp. ATCC 35103]|uniref:hypothetical protein n=1 Tax=[Flexibacter] sp. ATCC 35103 TaxID=1937528 RepID=UPI002101B733|nr:hypothetical protein [[Flexibacter] sp. ATCC 35103]